MGLPLWLAPWGTHPLAALIDHTLLKPEAGDGEVDRLCDEAIDLGFGHVCLNGQWIEHAAGALRGSGVGVASVVGFPLGAAGTEIKVAEARLARAHGADEIDMMIALGWALSGAWKEVGEEIAAVVAAADGAAVKVILETAALAVDSVRQATEAAALAGAAAVKTSTGFHPAGGATVEAVRLMRSIVGGHLGVKASGGIRTAAEAWQMLEAGADRIGTSSAATWGASLARRVELGPDA